MKKVLTGLFAMAMFLSAGDLSLMRAQRDDRSTLWPEPPPKRENLPPKNVVLSGRFNDTGEIFIADNDLKSWKVSNADADAVKHHRNERVTIHAIQDFRSGSLTVQSSEHPDVIFSH
jgi:hypothetical protein